MNESSIKRWPPVRWLPRAAWLCVVTGMLAFLCMILSGPLCRIGVLGFDRAIGMVRLGFYIGILTIAISLPALAVTVMGRQSRYLVAIFTGLVLGVASVAVPYTWLSRTAALPAIHDISTDADNPPSFRPDVLSLRKHASNSAVFAGKDAAKLQARAYPDIQPLEFKRSWTIVYPAALRTVEDLGWKLDSNDPMTGIIEATVTSPWFGMRYDVVVRIRTSDKTTRLDMRSASRAGQTDAGYDAHLIRSFSATLYKQLGIQPGEQH